LWAGDSGVGAKAMVVDRIRVDASVVNIAVVTLERLMDFILIAG